jgi:hypothetical protein
VVVVASVVVAVVAMAVVAGVELATSAIVVSVLACVVVPLGLTRVVDGLTLVLDIMASGSPVVGGIVEWLPPPQATRLMMVSSTTTAITPCTVLRSLVTTPPSRPLGPFPLRLLVLVVLDNLVLRV